MNYIMKKLIFTSVLVAAALGVAAQSSTAVIESKGVALYTDNSGESFSINILGFNIGFGEAKDQSKPQGPVRMTPTASVRKHDIEIHPKLEFGFNYLPSPDYSNYSADNGEFLDLRTGKSIHIGWNPVVITASLDRRKVLGVMSGFSLVWRDYAFSDRNMTLAKINGTLAPVPIEGSIKKSKLSTFALRIPAQFTIIEPHSKVGIGLGGYVDFVVSSHTKYKFPKNREYDNFYVNPLQFGLQMNIKYKAIGIFANYGLNDMFLTDKAPAVRPFTIGFGLGF